MERRMERAERKAHRFLRLAGTLDATPGASFTEEKKRRDVRICDVHLKHQNEAAHGGLDAGRLGKGDTFGKEEGKERP